MGVSDAKAEARVTVRLRDEDEARQVAASLGPDNEGYISCEQDGSTLTLRAKAGTAMGLLRTLDDALACIRATGVE